MSRYVNADALPRHGQRGGIVHWKDIDDAPSIDIVRCKECRLNETDDCPMVYYTPLEDGVFETRWWNKPDDFCSWGERNCSEKPNNSERKEP